MVLKRLVVGVAAALLLANPVTAQEVLRVPVDRIVAVVGETPIPYSRIIEAENTLRFQGRQIPYGDPEAYRALQRTLLEGLVDDELMVQAAERDTMVVVADEDVQSAVEETLQGLRTQYRSTTEFNNELQQVGFKSVEDYRAYLAAQQRREMLQSGLLQQLRMIGELQPLPPTEAEMREMFEATRGQFQERPATVSYRQIVVPTKADTAAMRVAYMRADSVRQRLLAGEDFAALARELSDDEGTKHQGGNLGWVRRGRGLVREFEEVAFTIRPGFYSIPVITPFGVHIIEVQRSEPASVQVRHILISPGFTDEDKAIARAEADSVKGLIEAGFPFDSLVTVYHDRTEERTLDNIPRDRLPPDFQQALAGALPGQIIGPIEIERNSRTLYAVVIFQRERPAGPATFEDVRDALRNQIGEQNAIQRYIEVLRSATYIDIRL